MSASEDALQLQYPGREKALPLLTRSSQFSSVSEHASTRTLHNDFVSLLAIAQKLKIDFLPITWQPALDALGRGSTAEIRQLLVNVQWSLAFKCLVRPRSPQNHSAEGNNAFKEFISEISVLGQPSIRNHSNIINLQGICWEIRSEEEILPVLVFEKSQCGDLYKFIDSEQGKGLCIEDRINLCIDIASAVMVMHSSYVIHGDIKPENILIFKDDHGSFIPKLTDFSFSTLSMQEDELIRLPRSNPWDAPEWHHRGFRFSAAKKMDAYSFGALCLWLIFRDKFGQITASPVSSSNGQTGYVYLKEPWKEYPKHTLFEKVKYDDQLSELAHYFINMAIEGNNNQKSKLESFFTLTLTSDPEIRGSDFARLITLLGKDGIIYPSAELGGEELLQPHVDFQVSRSLLQLCAADYRVRKHIVICLKSQAETSVCESCKLNAAFQLAFCYKIGFGVKKNMDQVLLWMERSRNCDLDSEILATCTQDWRYRSNGISSLQGSGYLDIVTLKYGTEYQKTELLENVEMEYTREIQDMEESLGNRHNAVRTLKSIQATVLSHMGKYERSKALEHELKEELWRDPKYGPGHSFTITKISKLADLHQREGKYDMAQEMFEKAVKWSVKMLGRNHPTTLGRLHDLADNFRYQGKYEIAEIIHREVLKDKERLLGREHPYTLDSINQLAIALRFQGKNKEAEEMHQQALKGREKALESEHTSKFGSISSLARVLLQQGQYKMAEDMCRQALQGCTKLLGKQHPATLICLNNLADVLLYLGEYEAAEEIYQQVLQERGPLLGMEHLDMLATSNNLTVAYRSQGKYEAAESLQQQTIELSKKVLGERHPQTLAKIGNLAELLRCQGKFGKAEEMQRHVLHIRGLVLGSKHFETLTAVSHLALVLHDQGKYSMAEELNQRVIGEWENTLGREHPDVLGVKGNLALDLRGQLKLDAAEKSYRQLLETKEKILGKDHPNTLVAATNLALVLQDQGKYVEAEKIQQPLLQRWEKVMGRRHPSTLRNHHSFADLLQKQGKYEAAEEKHLHILRERKEVLGEEHPDTLGSMNSLAVTLKSRGKFEEAEKILRRLIEMMQKLPERANHRLPTTLSNLAVAVESQGRHSEAEQLYRQALKEKERICGQGHPETVHCINNLATLLGSQGKYSEAEQMYRAAMEGSTKVYGMEHPSSLRVFCNFAHMLHKLNRYDEAWSLYDKGCQGLERVLGKEHPDTKTCTANFAQMVKDMKLLKENPQEGRKPELMKIGRSLSQINSSVGVEYN